MIAIEPTIQEIAATEGRASAVMLGFESMSDDQLLAWIDGLRMDLQAAKERLSQAELTMTKRMEDRGATKYDGLAYEATLQKGSSRYEYDFNVLEGLKPLVKPEVFDLAMQPSYKVDKRALNDLKKQGGEIALIIDNGVIETPGLPKLVLTPKSQGEEA